MDIADTTVQGARVIRNVFETSVREVSRLGKWSFLMTRESLGKLSTTPIFGWENQFQLPADYIRIVEFNREDVWDYPKDRFEREGNRLLTNEDVAEIKYIRYESDTTQFDPLFVEALAVYIASKIATVMRQDEALARDLANEFAREKLPTARRIDGTDRKPQQYDIAVGSRFLGSRRISTNG